MTELISLPMHDSVKYVDDMEVRRGPFRPDHLKHLEVIYTK